MLRGKVSGRRQARVRLRVRGPGGTEQTVAALVDTGFTGTLTLPDQTITGLGLNYLTTGRWGLADGREVRYDAYAAEVWWGDGWRPVVATATGGEALVGMQLLLDHELRVAVVPGGAVEITPMA